MDLDIRVCTLAPREFSSNTPSSSSSMVSSPSPVEVERGRIDPSGWALASVTDGRGLCVWELSIAGKSEPAKVPRKVYRFQLPPSLQQQQWPEDGNGGESPTPPPPPLVLLLPPPPGSASPSGDTLEDGPRFELPSLP